MLTPLPYNSNSTIQWGCQLLLKLEPNYLYDYCIFVESLQYKVLIFCLCGWFGVNSLLVLTTTNSAVQWGCQFLLKLSITEFYAYCIFIESLCYKVIVYWLCGWFGGNSLLVLTTLPYNSNSAIQWGCQLLLKLYITYLHEYFIFVEYLHYNILIFCLCGLFGGNSSLIWTTFSYKFNSTIQWDCQLYLKLSIT